MNNFVFLNGEIIEFFRTEFSKDMNFNSIKINVFVTVQNL